MTISLLFIRHLALITAIFLVSILIRYPLLINSDHLFTSDDGMMANTILRLLAGDPIVFYYDSVKYMGLTFGLASVPFMWILGIKTVAYQLPATLFYSLYVWTNYLLAKFLAPRTAPLLLVLMLGITMVVVAVSTGVRKIPVQYAKRVVGRKVYGGQATHIPLRILTAGVMPIIFAQALMFIPSTIASFFPQGNGFGDWLQIVFAPTHIVYSMFFAFLIIIFTYFYTAIAFNPVDVADNMKKQGGFIPGVRPGKSTSDYIDHILTRVTLPASVFLALIAIFPTFLSGFFNVDFSLASFYGGTSLLIIVGVALDTLQQIESHLLMRHYDGFLKTGKLKGRDRRR